jgi:hypothetical protein
MLPAMTRVEPIEDGTERETLTTQLDYLRGTVLHKVAGLTDEQALGRPVPASGLTTAGLVKHLTGAERFWFSIDFAGADLPHPWADGDRNGGFKLAPGETLAGLAAEYEVECARSRQVVAAAELDDVARGPDMSFRLRYALTHMIEETARHCGHLDLLRESIDGQRGQ